MSKNNQFDSSRKKRRFNSFLRTIATILICVTLCGVALVFVGGGLNIENPFERDVNDKNLLKVENYFDNRLKDETSKGMKINWKNDGSFSLSGKHVDEDLPDKNVICYVFTEILLTPGTYTLSAGNKNAAEDTFGVYAQAGDDIWYVEEDQDGTISFTLTETKTVVIGWFVKNNYRIIYQKVAPTLVSGEAAIDFYK